MPTIKELHQQLYDYGRLRRETRKVAQYYDHLAPLDRVGTELQDHFAEKYDFLAEREKEVRELTRRLQDLEFERKMEVSHAEAAEEPTNGKSDRPRGWTLLDSLRAR